MFKKLIKFLFGKSNLSFLNVGDIIWGKRYQTEEEKEQIEVGHREGPFVVIKKTRRKVYVLFCGGNKLKPIDTLRIKLSKDIYNFKKDSYVYVRNLILFTDNDYIKTIGKLTENDKNNIYKRIYLINKYKKIIDISKKELQFNFTIGDIIRYKHDLYYIKSEEDNKFLLLPLNKSNKTNAFKINGIGYGFNFNGYKLIDKSKSIKLIDFTEEVIQNNISLYEKKILKEKVNDKVLNRGKVIYYQNNYYFIYGEYKGNLLTYKIYGSKINKKLFKITINNGMYFTDFKSIMQKVNKNMKIVKKASELECDEIRRIKKEIFKKNKNK